MLVLKAYSFKYQGGMFTKNTVSEYVLRTWQRSKIISVKLKKNMTNGVMIVNNERFLTYIIPKETEM
jgi:hypothetical protein